MSLPCKDQVVISKTSAYHSSGTFTYFLGEWYRNPKLIVFTYNNLDDLGPKHP